VSKSRQGGTEGILGHWTEGPNAEMREPLISSISAMNPNGGAGGRRVMEVLPLDPIPLERVVSAVDVDSVSGYGPMISANRPVRTRMRGGVGRDG
jgi:hypothetical protein